MQPVNFPENNYQMVGASGECPHCGRESYCRPRSGFVDGANVLSPAQCEACKEWVLVIGTRTTVGNSPSQQITVYPMGKPDDKVPQEVTDAAKGAAIDFAEALRCHWVKSYKASVVMCRRAVQSSAILLQAKGGRLIDQIDDLFMSGKITEALKDYAHEVRLTGNDGAHPDKDGLAEVAEKDSSDIIEFTREFLNHIFVIPARFKARKNPPTASASGTK